MKKTLAHLLRALLTVIVFYAPSSNAGMALSPGVGIHDHADANTGGAAIDCPGPCSNRACATGFTRKGPNYCRVTTFANDTWTNATTCTQQQFVTTPLPAGALAAVIGINWRALSNNATGLRFNQVFFWTDTSCATNTPSTTEYSAFEFAATVAGTNIGETTDHIIVPTCATNRICSTQSNAGGNGNAKVQVVVLEGYID